MKKYKIVADSSLELNDEMLDLDEVELVHFKIYIGDEEIDVFRNSEFDLEYLLSKMKKSFKPTRTACPSPAEYAQAIGDEGDVFVITISSHLSGSYSSAIVARDELLKENSTRKIHVFDSLSASVGETQVYVKIKELLAKGFNFEDIVKETEKHIDEMKTFFILNSLDNLMKNGRISIVKGLLGSVLNFSPIMDGSTGIIHLHENVRGKKKSVSRLIEIIGETASKMEDNIFMISHCNATDLAEFVAGEVKKLYSFKDVKIFKTGDLSSVYCDDGGIICTY